eukprot:GEMP01006867.1.p1 GENE.GEMP01006867.1~~GEMP01006867.1.p1  ORF type:complete len:913 (+),score=228.50 GEMP01006867.1:55-2739(+)
MAGTMPSTAPGKLKMMASPEGPFDGMRRASCFVNPGAAKSGMKPALFSRPFDDLDFDKKKEECSPAKAAPPKNAFFMPTALSDMTGFSSRMTKAGIGGEDDERCVPRQNFDGEHSSPRRIPTYEKMFNEITRGYMKESELRRGCLKAPAGREGRRHSMLVNTRRQSMSNVDRAAWGLPPKLFTQHSTASATSPRKSNNENMPAPICISMNHKRRSLVVFGRSSLEKKTSTRISNDIGGSLGLSRMRRVVEDNEHRTSANRDWRVDDKDEDAWEHRRDTEYSAINVRFRDSVLGRVSVETGRISIPRDERHRVTMSGGGFVDELRTSVLSNKRASTQSRDSALVLRGSTMSDYLLSEDGDDDIIVTFRPVLDVIALRKWLVDGITVTRRNIESLAHLYQYAMRYMLLPLEYTFGDFTRDVQHGRKDVLRVMLRDNTPYVSRAVRRAKALAKESGRYLTLTLDQQLTELFHMQYHYKTITSSRAMIARKLFNPTPKKKKRKAKRYNQSGGWVMEAKQLAMETAEQKDSLWSKINTYFHVRNHIKMVLKSTCSVQPWHDFARSPVKPAKPKDGQRALPRDRMRWLLSNPDPYGRQAEAKSLKEGHITRRKKAFFPILAAPVWNFAPRMTREELFKTVLTDHDSNSSESDTSYSSDDEVDDSASTASSSTSTLISVLGDLSPGNKGVYRRHTLDSAGVPSPKAKCEQDSARRLSGRDVFQMPDTPPAGLHGSSLAMDKMLGKDRLKLTRGLVRQLTAPMTPPVKMKFAMNDENKPMTNQGFIAQMMDNVGANDRGNVQGPLLQRRQSIELQRRNSVDINMPMPVRVQGKNGDNMINVRMSTTPSPGVPRTHRATSSADTGAGISGSLGSRRRRSADERESSNKLTSKVLMRFGAHLKV